MRWEMSAFDAYPMSYQTRRKQQWRQLEEALNEPSIREEAAEVLRSLIDRGELRPQAQARSSMLSFMAIW